MTKETLCYGQKIRDAQPDDSRDILIVQRDAWLQTYPNEALGITSENLLEKLGDIDAKTEERKKFLQSAQNNQNIHYSVAVNDGKIVGFLFAIKGENNIIEALYVSPVEQNQGVGTILMRRVLEWFGSNSHISVNVVSYNHDAMSFYEKFGFIEDGPAKSSLGQFSTGKTMPETRMRKG